jgi:hypothetical protein
MLMFIMLFFPGVLASVWYFHMKQKSLASLELLFFVPMFVFLVNLLDMGFLYVAGFATLVLENEPLTVSFLMKYGALSLVSAVFLPNSLRVLEFAFSAFARVLAKSPRNGKPEQGTQKTP